MQSLGQRGVRLDQSLPGTGLGLGIAYEILEINHWDIQFSQPTGGGLVVTITRPLAAKLSPFA
jgi:signal transduction histidine kinase